MKAVNIVIGFVVFSIVLSMMFAATSDMMDGEGVDGANTFNELSGDYNTLTNELSGKDSTTRDIEEQLDIGEAGGETSDITLLTGALSSGRLIKNYIGNFDNIIHNATGDANTGAVYIDSRITGGIIAIIIIIFIFIIMHFIRGFKTET